MNGGSYIDHFGRTVIMETGEQIGFDGRPWNFDISKDSSDYVEIDSVVNRPVQNEFEYYEKPEIQLEAQPKPVIIDKKNNDPVVRQNKFVNGVTKFTCSIFGLGCKNAIVDEPGWYDYDLTFGAKNEIPEKKILGMPVYIAATVGVIAALVIAYGIKSQLKK